MKVRTSVLFILALLAITVISWDYTSGHTVDDVLSLTRCPICESFHSTVVMVVLLYILILLGVIPAIRMFPAGATTSLHSQFDPSIHSYRAPPVAA